MVPRAVKAVASLAELDDIIKTNAKVAASFCAEWSSPCRLMKPKFKGLSDNHDNIVFASVDIDRVGEAIKKYEFTSIPTFITFMDGQEFGERVVGPAPYQLEEQVAILSSEGI